MKFWIGTVLIGALIILLLDMILLATKQDIPIWYFIVMPFAVFGLSGAIVRKLVK